MILPESYAAVLLLAVLAAACWSVWPSTFKMAANRRFELYYLDFALGAAMSGVLASMTLGVLGGDITVMDNLTIVFKRDLAYSFAGGAVLNLGTMLLVAALSISGGSASFSMAAGASMFATLVWRLIGLHPGSIGLGVAGVIAAAGAAACAALAFAAITAAKNAAIAPPPVSKLMRAKPPKPPGPWKAITLALLAGLVMAASAPLFSRARTGIIELTAYGIALPAAAAVVISTMFFGIWFINLPVEGAAVALSSYRTTGRNHRLGLAGGALWFLGLIMFLLVIGAPSGAGLGMPRVEAFRHGAWIVVALIGWLAWRERESQVPRARLLVTASLALLAAAVALGFLAR